MSEIHGCEFDRSMEILGVLANDSKSAENLYFAYKTKRPEAAYFWGHVAIKLGSDKIKIEDLEVLRLNLLIEKFVYLESHFDKEKLVSMINNRNPLGISLFFSHNRRPEESLFWHLENNRLRKNTFNNSRYENFPINDKKLYEFEVDIFRTNLPYIKRVRYE